MVRPVVSRHHFPPRRGARCHPAARSLNEASTISGETHTVAARRFDRLLDRGDDLLSAPLKAQLSHCLIDELFLRPKQRVRLDPLDQHGKFCVGVLVNAEATDADWARSTTVATVRLVVGQDAGALRWPVSVPQASGAGLPLGLPIFRMSVVGSLSLLSRTRASPYRSRIACR